MKKKLQSTIAGSLQNVANFAEYAMKDKKLLGYQKEMGAIISPDNKALHYVYGQTGHVEFPSELAWALHKRNPGVVYKFAHVHPPRMTEPSSRDLAMLKSWAMALHPFPARLSVITYLDEHMISEVTMFGQFEAKEVWLEHKEREREYVHFDESAKMLSKLYTEKIPDWMEFLLKNSYHGRLQ